MHDATPPTLIKKLLVLSLSTVAAVLLCSCGKAEIRKPSGAITARAGEDAPVIKRLDGAAALGKNIARAQTGRPTALDRLRPTDEDLLAQEALHGKLDRDARVAQAIERARRQILAQAYIERTVNSVSQPSVQEIRKFYDENPALFEQRRIYRVLELVVVVAPDQIGVLRDEVAGAKNLTDVMHWLDARNLPFESAMPSRAAEQLSANILRRLFTMNDGQIALFVTPHGASVLRLEQSTQAPLSEQQAKPVIARYLLNRKRLELAQAAVAKLRDRAKFDYDDIEPARPATVRQAVARAQPRAARQEQEMAQDTIDFARLR
jgi:EpsD family peptidyl-prolyl cis-trans isomerase